MATKKLEKTPIRKAVVERFGDIMIDLETLSTDVDCAILSIGACRFNIDSIDNEGFYRVVTIQSNIDEGRHISPSTLVWWLDQDAKAKAVFKDPTAIPLGQALDELREWIGPDFGNVRVWGNGSDFDISALKHAYNRQDPPWIFWNVRCFRTMKNLAQAKTVVAPKNHGAHNALFDAIAQAQHLQLIWKALAAK